MAEITFRAPRPGDAQALAAGLRAQDAAEVAAYGHEIDLVEAIASNIGRSLLCWTAEADGALACVFGVTPLSMTGGIGSPWMLGTPLVERHARVLVRESPGYIQSMLQVFPHLINYVHAQNTTSVRWLRRMGFTLHPAVSYGALGESFHPFELKA